MLHRYVHGSGVDQPLVWYDGGTVNATNRRHLFANWQGSISLITDHAGNTVQVNAYDAYGIPNDTNIGRFQYTGQIMIPELGIYHYKARTYSPYLGRFLQTDPIGYDDQFNLYAYVGNDPVGRIDPTGAIGCEASAGGYVSSSCRSATAKSTRAKDESPPKVVITVSANDGDSSGGIDQGHAWVTLEIGDKAQSFSLWKDGWGKESPYNGPGNDIRENVDVNRAAEVSLSQTVDRNRVPKLMEYLKSNQTYSLLYNNCADFAARAWILGTGDKLDSKNILGFDVPDAIHSDLQRRQKR